VPTYVAVPVLPWPSGSSSPRSYRKVERVLLTLGFVLVTYVISASSRADWARRCAAPPCAARAGTRSGSHVIAAVGTRSLHGASSSSRRRVVDRKTTLSNSLHKYEIYAGSVIMTGIDFFIVVACAPCCYKEGIVVESARRRRWPRAAARTVARSLFVSAARRSRSSPPGPAARTAYVVCEGLRPSSPASTRRSARRRSSTNHHVLHVRAAAVAMIPGLRW